MQFVFVFALRDIYDENVMRNLKNSQFFEQIENWVYEQNQKGNLPQVDAGDSVKLEVTKSGCLDESNMHSGRWQMEMRLVYRQN